MSERTDEAFAELGREIARQVAGPSLDEHVESAAETLTDDDLVAFALVAIRQDEDGIQGASQRCIDPERVIDADDGEAVVDALHEALCQVFDEEVRDRE